MERNRLVRRWSFALVALAAIACITGCVNNHVNGNQMNILDPSALTEPLAGAAGKFLLP